MKKFKTLLGLPLVGIIKFYQWTLGAVLPRSCRFYPSCSEYSLQAVRLYGPFKGGWMAVKRISRCHPMNPGGYDPVPQPEEKSSD